MKREWATTMIDLTDPQNPKPPNSDDGWRLVGVAGCWTTGEYSDYRAIALFWERETGG